jgi:hypothetical protein
MRPVTAAPAAPGRELRAESNSPGQEGRPALVGAAWALLVLNVLGTSGTESVLPIPQSLLQMITMGALGAAFVLALVLNPRVRIRPSGFLLLLSLLVVVSIISGVRMEGGIGGLFRCGRFAVFVATLWLLTPWWDDAMSFVRYHVRVLSAVLGSVVVGLVVAPGYALPEFYNGRLAGALWPMPPPLVGQYAAVVAGLTLVLWMARLMGGWSVVCIATPAIAMLLMSHTRTAALGFVAAVVVAGLTLALTNARARRALAVATACAGVVAVAFAANVQEWLRRGQDEDAFSNLTGRQKVWDMLLDAERTHIEQLFGVGLTNKSFNGLSIDSGWLAVYHEQGVVGITIVVTFLVGLLIAAATRPPSPERACAVFLIVFCLVASYTEVGLGDASDYLLHLTVAAALLMPTMNRFSIPEDTGGFTMRSSHVGAPGRRKLPRPEGDQC